jgi:hypothetical protein
LVADEDRGPAGGRDAIELAGYDEPLQHGQEGNEMQIRYREALA